MMPRATGCLLALTVATTGCTMSSSSRKATMLAGAGLGIAGVVVIRSGEIDRDRDGVNETVLDDDWGAYYTGSLLLLAGAAAVLGALASREPTDEAPAPGPLVVAAPPAPSAAPPDPEPPPQVVVERRPAVPLPALPTSEAAHRLARQLRSAATFDRCEVAWIMWADLERLDPIYARAVRDGPVMEPCAR